MGPGGERAGADGSAGGRWGWSTRRVGVRLAGSSSRDLGRGSRRRREREPEPSLWSTRAHLGSARASSLQSSLPQAGSSIEIAAAPLQREGAHRTVPVTASLEHRRFPLSLSHGSSRPALHDLDSLALHAHPRRGRLGPGRRGGRRGGGRRSKSKTPDGGSRSMLMLRTAKACCDRQQRRTRCFDVACRR